MPLVLPSAGRTVRILSAAATTVWAADVAPGQSPTSVITPARVTASTAGTDFFAAGRLVDGSGLSAEPTAETVASVTHAPASASTAWVTADPPPGGGDWFGEGNPAPVLTFALPGLHEITGVVVWGYHFGAPNNNEAKTFVTAFSEDGGASWRAGPSFTHARSAESPIVHALAVPQTADTVRLTVTDNHFGSAGAGGGDRVGIGEIRFLGTGLVDPAPAVAVAPRIVDFGSLPGPAPPEPVVRSVEIRNNGGADDLALTNVRITGDDADRFRVVDVPGAVAAGAAAESTISFDAIGAPGRFLAWLEIATNDPDEPLVAVPLIAAAGVDAVVPEPAVFSRPSGTFVDSFELEVRGGTGGALVLVTTDGSDPVDHGIPIPTDGNGTLVIDATTRVRAAVVSPGAAPVRSSASYVRIAANLAAHESPLPILVIENFDAGPIPDKGWSTSTQTGGGLRQVPRQSAALLVHDRNPDTGRARLGSPPDTVSPIGIRVRGAFSSTWSPPPYSFETWDESGGDRDVGLLDLPSESDWILYYPHPSYDRTMLANTFIWELSAGTGRWAPRFRFVEVFVNEDGGPLTGADRRGVYALVEKVKRADARLDFDELSADGATGGWLLGINRMDPEPEDGFPAANGTTSPQFFHTAGPNRRQETPPNTPGRGDDIPRQYNAFINFEDPNGYQINTDQRAAIELWFRGFEDALYDEARWTDPVDGYRAWLDTRDFIGYFQLLNLARQGDGLLLSMFPWVSSGDRKLRMGPMWDFNNGSYDGSGNPEATPYFRRDRLWYPRLFADAEFLTEYIDHWFEMRRGPLADDTMSAIIDRQAAEITPALAERQGAGTPAAWQARLDAMRDWLHRRAGWIDDLYGDLHPPEFSLPAGVVPAGTLLEIIPDADSPGAVWLTLDGSDPRPHGGAAEPTAAAFPSSGSLELADSVRVRARTLAADGQWSALNDAVFIAGIPASPGNLAITEIHYHPADPNGTAEFIELANVADRGRSIELTGVSFTEGIRFTFDVGTTLAPGARLVVAADRAAFLAAHPDVDPGLVAGEFDGRLDNGGETITLTAADGSAIATVRYDDDRPWPESADGHGPSLVLGRPQDHPDPADPASWRPSTKPGGNPGTSDAIAFTGDPQGDADANGVPDLVDHALGSPFPRPVPGDPMAFRIDRRLAADDVDVVPEISSDLSTWISGDNAIVLMIADPPIDGIERQSWRVVAPPAGATGPGRLFLRLRVEAP